MVMTGRSPSILLDFYPTVRQVAKRATFAHLRASRYSHHNVYSSQILQQALEFRVFDAIEEFGGIVTLDKLAAQENYDKRILEKLLNSLVSCGLLTKSHLSTEQDQCAYSNTEGTKKYLLGSSPGTLSPLVSFFDYLSRKTVRDLPTIMKKGIQSVCYTDDLIKRRRSSLAILQRSLSTEHFSAEGFGLVMDAYTSTCIAALTNAFDLSQHDVVVDLGGGFGLLAESLAIKYPEIEIRVFEQEHVIQMAKTLKPDLKIEMISGDFFRDELPEADLFILCHVIENWKDDKSHILLKKAFDKLPAGGQLLLVEKFLSEDKTEPENPVVGSLFSAIMDLEGDYKTEEEYRVMLEKAGFSSIQSKCIDGYNDHDVMLASKKVAEKQTLDIQ